MPLLSNEAGVSHTIPLSGSALDGSGLPAPLKIGVSSAASPEGTGDWRADELHNFVLCIIEREVSNGQKADDIVAFLTKHELPHDLAVNKVRSEVLRVKEAGKLFIMDKFLRTISKPSHSPTVADPDFGSDRASSYHPQFSQPYSQEARNIPFNDAQPSTDIRPSPLAPSTFEQPEDKRPTKLDEEEQVGCADSKESSLKVSSPEDELDSVSSETEETPFVPPPGSKAHGIVEKLQAYFGKLIDSQLGVVKNAGSPTSHGTGSSNPPAPCQSYGGEGNQSSRNKRSRWDENGNDDDSKAPDDQREDGNQRRKRQRAENSSKKRIACPFLKRFPAQFSTWRTCGGPGFDGMHRMKEHLKRRHFRENCCGRCGQQFQSSRLLQAHTRADVPCALVEISTESGFMSQIQWDEISGKRAASNANILERWREIYLIIFPDMDQDIIPGPYFDLFDTEIELQRHIDPNEYDIYLKQNLPGRIIVRLNEEFHFMAERAKQRMLEIIQQESSEVLKSYLLAKGIETHHPQSETQSRIEVAPSLADNNLGLFDTSMTHSPQGSTYMQHTQLGPFSSLLQSDMLADFSWLDDKDPADSAYGSNMMGVNSSVGDN
ncbi:hypothetical protein F5Y14DRAFT_153054 [Nemania sp. NC0429]|nr:hypothetical protein F5Y14DRAFT_153054 [Nemania sp. NC0429]